MVHIKQNPDNSELSNMAEVEVITVGNCEPIQIVVTIGYWDTLQITLTVGSRKLLQIDTVTQYR